jgi:hypothetical protein
MGAAAAAALLRKEREIVDAYVAAGATASDRARTPESLGVHEGVALGKLRNRAVLRPGQGDGLYVDRATWDALQALRRRLALVLLVIVAIGAALGIFWSAPK